MRESLRFLSAARGGTLWCDFDIDPTFFQGFLQLASQPAVCDQSVDIRQFGEGDKGILTNLIAAAEDDHLVGYGEHGFLDFRLPHVRGSWHRGDVERLLAPINALSTTRWRKGSEPKLPTVQL